MLARTHTPCAQLHLLGLCRSESWSGTVAATIGDDDLTYFVYHIKI